MSATSLLARLGLRLATLGSVASLAIAAPLAEGDVSAAAHTDASRIGVFFDRTAASEHVGVSVMGVNSFQVRTLGVVITPSALPGAPVSGAIVIDSGAANTLKWWDGTAWISAGGLPGGANTQLQYNNSGAFGGIAGFLYIPGSATDFDLRATRTYTQSTVASNNAGTLSVGLSLDPTTAPGGKLIALSVQNQLVDATGMASRSASIVGQYTKVFDTGYTGTAWDGEVSGHATEVFKTGSSAGAVNGARLDVYASSSSSISGINIYIEKSYTSSPNNVRGIVIGVESDATGTISQAYGIQISSVGSDTSTGTITNSYGIYIGPTSGANVTNAYGLYQSDANARSVFTGPISFSASENHAIIRVNANTVLDATHFSVEVDASGGAVTITLPDSTGANVNGRIYNIKKIDNSANAVTITRSGADTLDGAVSQALTAQWQSRTVQARSATPGYSVF